MLTPDSLEEKDAVKAVVAELVSNCLWYPQVKEANGQTKEHIIRVQRNGDKVTAEIRRR